MLKKISLTIFFVFLFTGCSFKYPFIDFGEDEIKVADNCRKISDFDKKLSCYEKISENNSFAQLRLGVYYADKKDYKNAVKYLESSIDNDNKYANLALAFLYFQGKGVEKNYELAFELLEDSADEDPNAAYQLSRFYLKGIYIPINTDEGVDLLTFAAEKNMAQAKKKLFDIYNKGLYGISRDKEKASYWKSKLDENIKDTTYEIYQL